MYISPAVTNVTILSNVFYFIQIDMVMGYGHQHGHGYTFIRDQFFLHFVCRERVAVTMTLHF